MNLGCHQLQHGNKPRSPPPPAALYVIATMRYLSGRLFCLLLPEDALRLLALKSVSLLVGIQKFWALVEIVKSFERTVWTSSWWKAFAYPAIGQCWQRLGCCWCTFFASTCRFHPGCLRGYELIWKGDGLFLIWRLPQIPWCQTSTIPSLSSEEALQLQKERPCERIKDKRMLRLISSSSTWDAHPVAKKHKCQRIQGKKGWGGPWVTSFISFWLEKFLSICT